MERRVRPAERGAGIWGNRAYPGPTGGRFERGSAALARPRGRPGVAGRLAHLAHLSSAWRRGRALPLHLVGASTPEVGGTFVTVPSPVGESDVRSPVSRVLCPRGRRPFLWVRPRGRPRTIYPEGMARVAAGA